MLLHRLDVLDLVEGLSCLLQLLIHVEQVSHSRVFARVTSDEVHDVLHCDATRPANFEGSQGSVADEVYDQVLQHVHRFGVGIDIITLSTDIC